MVEPVMASDRYSADDLLSMNIEELVNVKVTTLSRHEEKYMATAGAVFVISRDDMRRAGVRSIPEALRLAPGLQVSQTNMNQYQIGMRGQSDFFTDLLLVMVDGRPVYNTTFSGVWWVTQNYPLQDIERIEVVRGPGGAVWGSNAVNGVINIITNSAAASQGLRITGGGGSEDKGFGNISYGGSSGNMDFRLYAMDELRDGGLVKTPRLGYRAGDHAPDFRRMHQQGFRVDWQRNDNTQVTLHGDHYRVKTGVMNIWQPAVTTPAVPSQDYNGLNGFGGRNLVMKVDQQLIPDLSLTGQLFYDQYSVHTQFIRERKETYDADVQVNLSDWLHQDISLGSNLRRLRSQFDDTPQFSMPDRTTKLTSFFINDELRLFDDHLRITAGVKMERNSFTGWQYQPTLRVITQDENWALWAAASRAARTPNDSENGLLWNLKSVGPLLVQVHGTGQMQSEQVTSYEVGGRLRPDEKSLIEVTAFRNFYKGVPDVLQGTPDFATLTVPVALINVLNAESKGVEANVRYQPAYWMTVKGSYTWLQQHYTPASIVNAETLFTALTNKGQDPVNRFHVGISLNPLSQVEFDANYYYSGAFRQREGGIPIHRRLDMRLAWRPVKSLEISLVGQDMLQGSYQSNINSVMGYATLIQQRYYAQATYTYD